MTKDYPILAVSFIKSPDKIVADMRICIKLQISRETPAAKIKRCGIWIIVINPHILELGTTFLVKRMSCCKHFKGKLIEYFIPKFHNVAYSTQN